VGRLKPGAQGGEQRCNTAESYSDRPKPARGEIKKLLVDYKNSTPDARKMRQQPGHHKKNFCRVGTNPPGGPRGGHGWLASVAAGRPGRCRLQHGALGHGGGGGGTPGDTGSAKLGGDGERVSGFARSNLASAPPPREFRARPGSTAPGGGVGRTGDRGTPPGRA